MAIYDKDVMVHAMVEGDLRDDVHACIAKLERDHGDIGLGPLKEITAASHDALDYLTRTKNPRIQLKRLLFVNLSSEGPPLALIYGVVARNFPVGSQVGPAARDGGLILRGSKGSGAPWEDSGVRGGSAL